MSAQIFFFPARIKEETYYAWRFRYHLDQPGQWALFKSHYHDEPELLPEFAAIERFYGYVVDAETELAETEALLNEIEQMRGGLETNLADRALRSQFQPSLGEL